MKKMQRHPIKKWGVSIIELCTEKGKSFKVTRRIPELTISETRMLGSKEKAKKLFIEWLQ